MAILGSLLTALGCLFTSFATQLHQVLLAHGLLAGIGIGMMRDASLVLVGQYFKKRRELVEVPIHVSSGLGSAFMPLLLTFCIRSVLRQTAFLHPRSLLPYCCCGS